MRTLKDVFAGGLIGAIGAFAIIGVLSFAAEAPKLTEFQQGMNLGMNLGVEAGQLLARKADLERQSVAIQDEYKKITDRLKAINDEQQAKVAPEAKPEPQAKK